MNSIPHICFRIVDYDGLKDNELYVELKDGIFQLPVDLPTRFALRIRKQFVKNVFEINSAPYDTTILTKLDSFKDSGIWITKDDYKSVGNVGPTVFGIPLHEHVRWAFDVIKMKAETESKLKVFVGYHGTSMEAWKSIKRENLLKASFGQLGHGVYVGSFWKACRFAGRDQDYNFRDHPIVLRVLLKADPEQLITFPRKEVCTCKMFCTGQKKELVEACAHEFDWNSVKNLSYGFLKPTQMSDGKWITKNEEWIFPSQQVLRLSEAVELNKETIHKPDYDPWQRNIKLL